MQKETQIRVGYACLNLSFKDSFKNYRLATVENHEEDKIVNVFHHNIRLFYQIIDYNIKHNIYVYRMTSDLIPFCTHPYIETLYQKWVLNNKEMIDCLNEIKQLQERYELRISIHPSQFNVLSSPRKDVVKRSIEEINKQTEWIKWVNGKNVVIHVGGAYDDKKAAIRRFIDNLQYVDTEVISIENDDKIYHSEDVVGICEPRHLKWVYDYHHDRCYPSKERESRELIKQYPPDKYHLSSGAPLCHSRPHADYISKQDFKCFVRFLTEIGIPQADVIFEAKKKNKSLFHILEPLAKGFWKVEE